MLKKLIPWSAWRPVKQLPGMENKTSLPYKSRTSRENFWQKAENLMLITCRFSGGHGENKTGGGNRLPAWVGDDVTTNVLSDRTEPKKNGRGNWIFLASQTQEGKKKLYMAIQSGDVKQAPAGEG